jgi:hypothetical protein
MLHSFCNGQNRVSGIVHTHSSALSGERRERYNDMRIDKTKRERKKDFPPRLTNSLYSAPSGHGSVNKSEMISHSGLAWDRTRDAM